jgi:hypothetical protein
MLTWRDLEESAEIAKLEAAAAVETARLMLEIGEDDDEPVSLRRRIANALVQVGVKIDPMAAEGMVVAEDAV